MNVFGLLGLIYLRDFDLDEFLDDNALIESRKMLRVHDCLCVTLRSFGISKQLVGFDDFLFLENSEMDRRLIVDLCERNELLFYSITASCNLFDVFDAVLVQTALAYVTTLFENTVFNEFLGSIMILHEAAAMRSKTADSADNRNRFLCLQPTKLAGPG
jgi:hypothetical protein